MVRSILIATALATLGTAVTASAQYRDGQQPPVGGGGPYRDGQPMVMTPPPPPADPAIGASARFRAAYARAGRPRIVIFWNREFTDDVATKHESYTNLHSRTDVSGQSSSSTNVGYGYADTASQGSASSETNASIRSGVDNMTDNRRDSSFSEAEDFDAEASFTSQLQGAGANLIDRTSIMRTTGLAKRAGETSNIQGIETSAILGKADIVLEVVQLADSRKASGVSFRVIARNVRSGKVVATLSTSARPPVGRMPFVAGSDGRLVRAVAPEPGPQQIGRQLAVETMSALSVRM
jgi:hypothetical protein